MARHDRANGVENVVAGQVERRRNLDVCRRLLMSLLAHEVGAR